MSSADHRQPSADIYALCERLMGMSDEAWARHAHPLSAYSRIFSATPMFIAAWSPFWIGWWGAGLIALVLAWLWLNPRLFSPPQTTDSWATRAVLGERAFLARKTQPVPQEHVRVAHITTGISVMFLMLTVVGFYLVQFWTAFAAWHAAALAKVWF
ncbi:MAG: DUF6653 family protein, partial [Pseudomonadota bacterium]